MRTCTMPVGTQLFFPVVNVWRFFILLRLGEERQEAIDFINAVLADPELRQRCVTVDGKAVKSNRIVRAQISLFTITLPEETIFVVSELPAGKYEGRQPMGCGLHCRPCRRVNTKSTSSKRSERRLLAGQHLQPDGGELTVS